MYSNQVPEGRAEFHPTFGLLPRPLADLGVVFSKYYDSDLKVYESKLDGISFNCKKPASPLDGNDLLTVLRIATRSTRPAVREGNKMDHEHWAIDASMGAT